VLLDYNSNKFTNPSKFDPLLMLKWDQIAFLHLPSDYIALELSPIAPFGSVSSVAPISQDWVLTTIRNTEVLSDASNILALECTLRRSILIKQKETKNTPVNLACSHRVIRMQPFEGANLIQHFRLFSLCSAGKVKSKLEFELENIKTHIHFYLESIRSFLEREISFRVVILDLSSDSQITNVIKEFVLVLRNELVNIDVSYRKLNYLEQDYYQNIRFKIYVSQGEKNELELIDGGATNWSQKLLNNAKERLVISGIGSERLCELSKK